MENNKRNIKDAKVIDCTNKVTNNNKSACIYLIHAGDKKYLASVISDADTIIHKEIDKDVSLKEMNEDEIIDMMDQILQDDIAYTIFNFVKGDTKDRKELDKYLIDVIKRYEEQKEKNNSLKLRVISVDQDEDYLVARLLDDNYAYLLYYSKHDDDDYSSCKTERRMIDLDGYRDEKNDKLNLKYVSELIFSIETMYPQYHCDQKTYNKLMDAISEYQELSKPKFKVDVKKIDPISGAKVIMEKRIDMHHVTDKYKCYLVEYKDNKYVALSMDTDFSDIGVVEMVDILTSRSVTSKEEMHAIFNACRSYEGKDMTYTSNEGSYFKKIISSASGEIVFDLYTVTDIDNVKYVFYFPNADAIDIVRDQSLLDNGINDKIVKDHYNMAIMVKTILPETHNRVLSIIKKYINN